MDDDLGRPMLANGAKTLIADALREIPEGKRGALVLFATEQGGSAHLAARINGNWKLAAGAGVPWTGAKPEGFVAIAGSW